MKKIILLVLLVSSCASRPVLYPNERYQKVGEKRAQKDVKHCMDLAEKFLKSSKGKQILKGAGRGSVLGTVIGGITGLITGDIVESLVSGAAAGAATGATGEAISPDRLKQAYVNRCLAKKGYEVVGWD